MNKMKTNDGHWYSTKKACEFYGVSPNTLRKWADNDKVVYKRSQGNKRYYFIHTSNSTKDKSPKQTFVYARVSSRKQIDDLERQIKFLNDKYPNAPHLKEFPFIIRD